MIKLNIRGDTWKIFVFDSDQFHNKFKDTGACAMTNLDDKHIYLEEDVDLITVKHELFHVYAFYLYLTATRSLSITDMEEIYAEMFAMEGHKIISQAKYLHKLVQSQ